MYLPDRELVPSARSPFSHRMTRKPRPAASRAIPAPLMPPPMTRRSTMPVSSAFICTYRSARIERWFVGEVAADLLCHEACGIFDGSPRSAGDMRGQRHVFEAEQGG